MKVLVNFGDVRCIVPVGDGNVTVRDVIDKAVDRYKKAVNTVSAVQWPLTRMASNGILFALIGQLVINREITRIIQRIYSPND